MLDDWAGSIRASLARIERKSVETEQMSAPEVLREIDRPAP